MIYFSGGSTFRGSTLKVGSVYVNINELADWWRHIVKAPMLSGHKVVFLHRIISQMVVGMAGAKKIPKD